MHRGEIFLYSGNGIISWFIKKITRSPVSHAGWIFKDHHIVEADSHGVEREEFSYDLDRCVFIVLDLPQDVIEKCLAEAESQVGKPYDYKLFLGLFWLWFWGKWDRSKKLKDWPSGYLCSELVAQPVYKHARIRFTPEGVDVQNTVPGDILTYALKAGALAKVTYSGPKVPVTRMSA